MWWNVHLVDETLNNKIHLFQENEYWLLNILTWEEKCNYQHNIAKKGCEMKFSLKMYHAETIQGSVIFKSWTALDLMAYISQCR